MIATLKESSIVLGVGAVVVRPRHVELTSLKKELLS